jgi:hypothetical protein
MALVHALLQPNYSFYRRTNEEFNTERYSSIENQDRVSKNTTIGLDANILKQVTQASIEIAIDKEINDRGYEQHAIEHHKIHISIDTDKLKLPKNQSKSKRTNKKDALGTKRTKANAHKTQNKHIDKKYRINLCTIKRIQLNNLIILLNNKVYLYIKSQLVKYNYRMDTDDKTISANWKTNTETYDMIREYFKTLNKNRRYFITWKLLSLITKDIPAFKTIVWRWNKSNTEHEDRIETKLKQEGVKIVIYMTDTNLKYDTIGMLGTKVKLNAELIVEHVEILDLIKSYKKNRFLPIENKKFNNKILNVDRDKDIWIRSGVIIANNHRKKVWYLADDYAILCTESMDKPSNVIDGIKQSKQILDHEADWEEKELMKRKRTQ